MSESHTILFFHSELSEYFLACVRKLLELFNIEVHIVHWPLNKQAPFKFSIPNEANLYSKINFDKVKLRKLVSSINPDLILSCGWMDRDYIKICKQFKKQDIPVIVGIDNHWKGSMRQYLAQVISRFTFHKYYSHIWIAGQPQLEYAHRLGFTDDKILSGYYSGDVDYFHDLYLQKKEENNKILNKRFIYVGRYLERKGLQDLWEAFSHFQQDNGTDWELWCLGTGPLQNRAMKHPKIKHMGFIQPRNLSKYIENTDVFILPSHREPWGVVVHEFAAAGFPLICSNRVGAVSTFLENNKNGYVYESGNVGALEKSIQHITNLSATELKKMGTISVEKAQKITPKKWAYTLMSVL